MGLWEATAQEVPVHLQGTRTLPGLQRDPRLPPVLAFARTPPDPPLGEPAGVSEEVLNLSGHICTASGFHAVSFALLTWRERLVQDSGS